MSNKKKLFEPTEPQPKVTSGTFSLAAREREALNTRRDALMNAKLTQADCDAQVAAWEARRAETRAAADREFTALQNDVRTLARTKGIADEANVQIEWSAMQLVASMPNS